MQSRCAKNAQNPLWVQDNYEVLLPNETHHVRLPSITGILTAELFSLLHTLRMKYHSPIGKFLFSTILMSALLSIQTFPNTHPLVLKMQEWLGQIFTR